MAYLEELSLHELYAKLVECGFKLSEEDVSCEHEKMQNDETIIRQMCILFSLVNYSEEDRKLDSHLYKYVGCQTCEDNEKRIYILSPTERCRTTNKVTSMSRSEMFM